MKKLNGEMPIAYPPKVYYKIHPSIKELLLATETRAEVDAYFDHINYCKELDICSECGQGIIFDSENRDEHVKEYSISGLCKNCQIKVFGV